MVASLTPEQAEFVDAAVASGRYPDAAAVLDDAIAALRARDRLRNQLDEAARSLDTEGTLSEDEVFAGLDAMIDGIERRSVQG